MSEKVGTDPIFRYSKNRVCPYFFCVLSAVCLILAFPKTDIWILSWVGLVPLMFVLDGKPPAAAFRAGYFCGILFFGGTLHWLVNMGPSAGIPTFLAVLAVILLVAYLALYFGLFAVFYVYFRPLPPPVKLFLYPSAWAGLEFIRDWLFTGFGWAALGYSQYKVLPVIQIADITGVFGVSFLIVMVNYALKEVLTSRAPRREMLIAGGILAAVLAYGVFHLYGRAAPAKEDMTVAVVQPNVPQQIKWEPAVWPMTMQKLQTLSKAVVDANPNLDLMIWPETSFPGYMWESPELYEELKRFVASLNVPLLFGAVMKDGERYYNAAILLSAGGQEMREYHKVHLVPFGEFIPFRSLLPWLTEALGTADFTAGTEYALFPSPVPGQKGKFSVLICFEDTIGRLARRFVRQGADLLVNMTNDAWFADSQEPYMHLQAAVFRAVENRRSLVRAANTGVSCFIDKFGRVTRYLHDDRNKKTFVTTFSVDKVAFEDGTAWYTKLGDIFTYICFGCILWGIVIRKNYVSL